MKETITPPTPTRSNAALRPLTRTRRDSGAPYRREADVEAQARDLLGLGERARQARLFGSYAGNDPDRPREETLVYFVRDYALKGDADTAWRLTELLVERIAGHVQRKLARWRLPAEQQDDCMRDLVAALCEAVFDHGPSAEFWEVRFWVCLDRRLWGLVEKRQQTLDAEIRPGDDEGDAEDSAAGGEGVFARIADAGPGPEALAEYKEAIALLAENERLAVYLRYVEGLPEESEDPNRESVAKILGVTGRSVRNYLRRAEAKLRSWHEGRA
jgi:hypothetical protein